jgi:hypothetical protein
VERLPTEAPPDFIAIYSPGDYKALREASLGISAPILVRESGQTRRLAVTIRAL